MQIVIIGYTEKIGAGFIVKIRRSVGKRSQNQKRAVRLYTLW